MKKLIYIALFSILSLFFFPTTLLATAPVHAVEEKNAGPEWSYYMDHVIHLLDYVEAMVGLREVFNTGIASHLDLFERKQVALDFISVTEDYLIFLEKYQNRLSENNIPKEEVEKIQALALPSVDNVRANLVLAIQTKGLVDKMIADKNAWKYQKTQLVFKDGATQKQYVKLSEQLATLEKTVEVSSLLTQKEMAR